MELDFGFGIKSCLLLIVATAATLGPYPPGMMEIRDIQHRFHVDGRTYVVEVCAPGRHAAPVTVGPFDVHIAADVPANFDAYDDDELENIVNHVADYVRPLMASVAAVEWEMFKASVCGWVCTHRTAAMIEDWHLERRELQSS